MLFTQKQIEELLKLIDLQTVYLIGRNLGEEALTTEDRKLLAKYGIDIDKITVPYPPYLKAFLFGRLVALLKEHQASMITYENFQKYIRSTDMEPLTRREQAEYEITRQKTYHHIKSFGERIKSNVNDIVIAEEQATRLEQERVLAGEISRGVLERKSLQTIISNVGRKMNNWNVDWGRIVDTEMQDVFNHGVASHIAQMYGSDQKVYKQTYELACRWCIKLHTTAGIGSEPIVFTLDELYANGSNVGLPKDEWKATVGPEHPFCYTDDTEVLTDQGWYYFDELTDDLKYLSVDLRTNNVEWVKAVKHIEVMYRGLVDVFKGNDFDLRTTPNHYHVVNTNKNNKEKFQLLEASNLKKSHRLLRTIINYKGVEEEKVNIGGYYWLKKDFIEFMAYFLNNGYVLDKEIKILQDRKSSCYDDILECCNKLFTKVFKSNNAIYISLKLHDPLLIDFFNPFKRPQERYIPDFIKNSCKEDLEIFLNAYKKCDQDQKTNEYVTKYALLAADLGEIILKTGRSPIYKERNSLWHITFNNKKVSLHKAVYVGQDMYEGYVYDVELEKNHTLIVRRNGKVCISGNCRCNIRPVLDNHEWDKKDKKYRAVAREPLVGRAKVKVRVGNQNFEV